MERICRKCKYFVVTGTSYDKRNRYIQEIGVCHKPGRKAKKTRCEGVSSELMWDDETCRAFKLKKQAASRRVKKNKQ
jgi:hypothetical protein